MSRSQCISFLRGGRGERVKGRGPSRAKSQREFKKFDTILCVHAPGQGLECDWHGEPNREDVSQNMQTNRRTWQSFDEMRKAAQEADPAPQCYLAICYQTGQ